MGFNLGDFVKGNCNHINSTRMSDVGVLVEYKRINKRGFFVAWFSDMTTQFAYEDELELVKQGGSV